MGRLALIDQVREGEEGEGEKERGRGVGKAVERTACRSGNTEEEEQWSSEVVGQFNFRHS